MVGIVLVSHRDGIAERGAELVGRIARGVRVVPAGGIGTSTDGPFIEGARVAAGAGLAPTTVANTAQEARDVRTF